ncbi:hypothetical protein HHJ81_10035 [Mobiluncus mulieris]|uniref:hypothetical protein n=1 Tax=Mobiluncus mulieris TaxID=2052 RepID=UPI0014700258|nr:hypothetical protein [Mobiluncus mulieris]MCU9976119.1 hypothetical protein [Mobiluncus mulieris]NMW61410.1 hypothetical protein [Mobiluncus mulieris]
MARQKANFEIVRMARLLGVSIGRATMLGRIEKHKDYLKGLGARPCLMSGCACFMPRLTGCTGLLGLQLIYMFADALPRRLGDG